MTAWIVLLSAALLLAFQPAEEVLAFAPAGFQLVGGRPLVCSDVACGGSAVVSPHPRLVTTSLSATGKKKKKRRRRRTPPGATAPDPIKVAQEKIEGLEKQEVGGDDDVEDLSPDDIVQIEEISKFEFKSDDIAKGVQNQPVAPPPVKPAEDSTSVSLPDIRQARRRKEMEEELARMEEEKEMNRPKVKRSDKEAFTRLLEQSPFADADDTLFEEEEYSTVSALLGERAEKFLGIPSGPLQVGHFVGALGIILMAYVEYPGFPLTNLPTPLRGALQGGLLSVYLINAVMAVVSVFKAQERGQPIPLWVAKTFSVGGLALDQLNQLPTLEQIEKAKSVKGARAIKKKR